MKIILVLCLLVFLSNATYKHLTVQPLPSTVVNTDFLKNAPHFKRHSFAELHTVIERAADASQVQAFLDNLLGDIENSRKQRLAIITEVRSQCEQEDAFRKQEVADGQTGAAASQTQLTQCNSQRDEAVHFRDLANSALNLYQQELVDLENARQEQHRIYIKRSNNLKELQEAIQEVLKLLDEFELEANQLVSSSFLQKTNKLFGHSVRTGHSQFIAPVFTKLIQMLSESKQNYNPGDVDEIRDLLNKLNENALVALQALDDQEAKDLAEYEARVDRINSIIARLQHQVLFTSDFINTMDQCVNQETAILALANDKITRNTDLLKQAQQLCSATEEEYRLSELSRVQEVKIVNAIKVAVNNIEGDFNMKINAKYTPAS